MREGEVSALCNDIFPRPVLTRSSENEQVAAAAAGRWYRESLLTLGFKPTPPTDHDLTHRIGRRKKKKENERIHVWNCTRETCIWIRLWSIRHLVCAYMCGFLMCGISGRERKRLREVIAWKNYALILLTLMLFLVECVQSSLMDIHSICG